MCQSAFEPLMHPEHMASCGKQFEEPSRCELVVLCLRTVPGFGTLSVTFHSTSGQRRAESMFPSPNPNPPNQGRARAPPYPPRCARLGKLLAPAAVSYHQEQCEKTLCSAKAAQDELQRHQDGIIGLMTFRKPSRAPKRPPRGLQEARDKLWAGMEERKQHCKT